jgi:hypothetical protein
MRSALSRFAISRCDSPFFATQNPLPHRLRHPLLPGW